MTATPDLSSASSPTEVARRVLDANAYLTLSTADASGRPWATPVWFADRDGREFVWVSRTTRRHSHNIAARPEVALAIFDSTTPVGAATAVYVEAVAAMVSDDGLADALAIFNGEADASGLPLWGADQVTGAAPFRLYRAVTTQSWILDEHENRVPLY
jgi:pyridoxine/pyridoxamine 5'-phosphate oxidase